MHYHLSTVRTQVLTFIAITLLFFSSCRTTHKDIIIEQPVDETPPAVHLMFGNPTGATVDITNPDNFLIKKYQYTVSYNNSLGTANWVSWHLSSFWRGPAPRQDNFRIDPDLPDGFFKATTSSYTGSGFDRGHLCPSEDRDRTVEDNSATFLMTNIIPQSPNSNRGAWKVLEDYARKLVDEGKELYIYAGGYGTGGTGSSGFARTVNDKGLINVPSHLWKIILVLPDGSNDLNRTTADTRVIAVIIPNNQTASDKHWGAYRVSVDEVEKATGFDFFAPLPDAIEELLEMHVDTVKVE